MADDARTDTPTGARPDGTRGLLDPIHRLHGSRSTMLRLSVAGMLTTLVVGGGDSNNAVAVTRDFFAGLGPGYAVRPLS